LESLGKVRDFVEEKFGADYLPDKPNVYKSRKSAQEAHEAIRPSDVSLQPKDVARYLSSDQHKLYELIWNRFVSCQMTPAVYKNLKIEISAGKFQFGVSGSNIVFDGFMRVYKDADEEESKVDFSHYHQNDRLTLAELKTSQHFTKPPARYSDASLVKALEEDGIGRPSTYASIIQTLVFRNYVVRDRGYFNATELGIKVSDLLVEFFARIMDVGFTAAMEENLDEIEEGKIDRVKLLKDFYKPFMKELEYAGAHMKRTESFVEEKCPECGRQMVVKWGRRGKFLSCSGFPKCKFAKPFTTGVKCPQENCTGELVQRQSRGRHFYGCSRYPDCTYTTNSLPKDEKSEELEVKK